MSYYGGGGGGYPGQGYQGSQDHGGYGGGGGYHAPPPGPPPDQGYGGYQGHGGGGYRPQEDQGYQGGYRPQQESGYGGYQGQQGGGYRPPPQDQGYGGYQQHQGGHYPPPTGPRPDGYGGEHQGGHPQKPRPPQHAPPQGLDAYGYPLPNAPYAAHNARSGPPPPSGPQHFGNGAPDAYTFQYSDCSGRRKALLIGINYLGQKGELRGCINDVHNLSAFLTERYNYKREDMVILTDDQENPVMRPTKVNIQRAMGWLVKDARPNDSLFLHYSGHGGQTEDLDGDEDDGYDEVIYPVDHTTEGHIVDDDIHAMVVKPLAAGVRLTAIFDSCHSATVMDLPYVYSTKGVLKEPNLAKEAGEGALAALSAYASGDMGGVASSVFKFAKTAYKGDSAYEKTKESRTSPADVIMWSGSKDDQTSADATIANKATGAMSYAFITAIKANPKQTYVELLNSIRDVLAAKYDQKPQLSCSHPLDTNLLFVM